MKKLMLVDASIVLIGCSGGFSDIPPVDNSGNLKVV